MDLDQQLKQLAIEAQQHPPQTPERQCALARLVDTIYRSKKLVRPYSGQFYGLYEDIYAEAQQQLFLYLCEDISRYNPELEVLQWANFLMRKRFFIEASRDFMPVAPKGMDRSQVKRITLDALDKQESLELRSQSNPSLSEEVLQCIRDDRDGLFKETHIRNKPAANFQHLALRFLGGYSWKEISDELGVKVVTLSSFYLRCLTKFAPKFKEYLTTHAN
ncbi:sigma-70 family RNA polymerase sigma factor [Adonisia turfae]|uniref:Sigma-70 family RNA polymerase sigma factor n=1 Tax=Adonisia turfae CCMR0081 TaxID=2292702 RepID=A0A6M0RR63_9CYAN|nr:sigma-70 family RNA polymerase sigma factor [Adonisia turfae]NEZ58666.1 sigma-70 family RNA polymerase sigma factor [Adonisia turfae CCMR0081]